MAQPNSAIPSHTTVISQQQQGLTSGNPTPDTLRYSQSYNGHGGRATGWIQLCCAVVMVLDGAAQYLLGSYIRYFSIGIWTGLLFYGPAGILGIASFRKRNAVISAYLTMSVFSAVFAFVMMLFGAISAGTYAQSPCWAQGERIPCEGWLREGRTASDAIMGIVGLIEMIVAIVGSAYGCGGVCCNKSPRPIPVHELHVVHQYPVVVSTNQQGIPHVPTDQPPPYMATALDRPTHYTPQQQQQIYPPEQTFPQQTNAPQQTFQQQQTFARPQTSTQQPNDTTEQHYTELHTYQPLIYPDNQGRQNSTSTQQPNDNAEQYCTELHTYEPRISRNNQGPQDSTSTQQLNDTTEEYYTELHTYEPRIYRNNQGRVWATELRTDSQSAAEINVK